MNRINSRKSRFLAFWCSLIPGAGEMYLGYFKTGFSVMGVFCSIVTFASLMNLGFLAFFLPVVWFYSFFHTHHLLTMWRAGEAMPEDCFFFNLLSVVPKDRESWKKYKKYVAVVLILLGLISLFNGVVDLSYNLLPESAYWALRNVVSMLPRMIFGIGIVTLGIYMIQGKRYELFADDLQEEWEAEKERRAAEQGGRSGRMDQSQEDTGNRNDTE